MCIEPRVCLKGAVKGDLIIPSGFRKSELAAENSKISGIKSVIRLFTVWNRLNCSFNLV